MAQLRCTTNLCNRLCHMRFGYLLVQHPKQGCKELTWFHLLNGVNCKEPSHLWHRGKGGFFYRKHHTQSLFSFLQITLISRFTLLTQIWQVVPASRRWRGKRGDNDQVAAVNDASTMRPTLALTVTLSHSRLCPTPPSSPSPMPCSGAAADNTAFCRHVPPCQAKL